MCEDDAKNTRGRGGGQTKADKPIFWLAATILR